MERNIYAQLLAWKTSKRRKPLIVNGARQVGKTFALQHFGKTHYDQVLYLNFERETALASYFEASLAPSQIIENLSLAYETPIKPETTLLIFDEIQECPRALNSLKYFCEEARQYHIVSAGSLLGVKTNTRGGFPVGKVDFLHLGPLNFFEFLTATGHDSLRKHLEQLSIFKPLADPLHEKLIALLKRYMYVGGMPEAVAEFINSGDYAQVREIQNAILAAYERDFAKHAPQTQVMKIIAIWKQVYQQLAKENKKFIFAAIRKSARGRDYEEAIQWLLDAGLIHKSCLVETPKIPIGAYAKNDTFKLFLLDTGLLGAQADLAPKALIEGERLFTEFKGALTENFVAQELICSRQKKLHYWTSPGTAKLDFLLEEEQAILPLEVKAGLSQKKKSLFVYDKKYTPKQLYRASLMNLKEDGKLRNCPLYLVGNIHSLARNSSTP